MVLEPTDSHNDRRAKVIITGLKCAAGHEKTVLEKGEVASTLTLAQNGLARSSI